jgi:hypothetical protein
MEIQRNLFWREKDTAVVTDFSLVLNPGSITGFL